MRRRKFFLKASPESMMVLVINSQFRLKLQVVGLILRKRMVGMATVKRAKYYGIYVLAILVSGLFSFFGKTSPAWTMDAKQAQNSKIFNEAFLPIENAPEFSSNLKIEVEQPQTLLAQAEIVDDRAFTYNSNANRAFTTPVNRVFTIERMFTSPTQVDAVNASLTAIFNEIERKIQAGETLTIGEMALLVQLQNAASAREMLRGL